MLTVEIKGMEKFQAMLEPKRFDRACERILDRGSQTWADETKKMPPVSAKTTGYGAKGMPVDSGLTRQEIRPLPRTLLAAGVIAPTNYASFIREGTSKMPPRDFFLFALEDFGAMKKIDDIVQQELTRAFSA